MENRKKGDVLLKASACDASARAPISVLAMFSSTAGGCFFASRDGTKLCAMAWLMIQVRALSLSDRLVLVLVLVLLLG